MVVWWLSSSRMTIFAKVDTAGVIVDTSPIARAFVRQPLDNLRRWLRKQGGFREAPLKV